MASNALLLLCAQAFLGQCISSQCIGAGYNGIVADGLAWRPSAPIAAPWNAAEAPLTATWAAAPCAATPFATAEWATGFAPASLTASQGGGLPITSASSHSVAGVSMTSENIYEGPLSVGGNMPFLGTVALEGLVPSLGSGVVHYGCGNGNIAMLTEDTAAGIERYGYAGLPYEIGLSGPAYNIGCGAIY